MDVILLWPFLILFLLSSLVAASIRRSKRSRADSEKRRLQELADVADSKVCPSCAEQIKAKANVCKHCGSDVSKVTAQSDSKHAERVLDAKSILEKEQKKEYHGKRLALYLLPVGLISLAGLIYVFVAVS